MTPEEVETTRTLLKLKGNSGDPLTRAVCVMGLVMLDGPDDLDKLSKSHFLENLADEVDSRVIEITTRLREEKKR